MHSAPSSFSSSDLPCCAGCEGCGCQSSAEECKHAHAAASLLWHCRIDVRSQEDIGSAGPSKNSRANSSRRQRQPERICILKDGVQAASDRMRSIKHRLDTTSRLWQKAETLINTPLSLWSVCLCYFEINRLGVDFQCKPPLLLTASSGEGSPACNQRPQTLPPSGTSSRLLVREGFVTNGCDALCIFIMTAFQQDLNS